MGKWTMTVIQRTIHSIEVDAVDSDEACEKGLKMAYDADAILDTQTSYSTENLVNHGEPWAICHGWGDDDREPMALIIVNRAHGNRFTQIEVDLLRSRLVATGYSVADSWNGAGATTVSFRIGNRHGYTLPPSMEMYSTDEMRRRRSDWAKRTKRTVKPFPEERATGRVCWRDASRRHLGVGHERQVGTNREGWTMEKDFDFPSMGGGLDTAMLLAMVPKVRRDFFAAQAMQAIIVGQSDDDGSPDPTEVANHAVTYADALIARLDR